MGLDKYSEKPQSGETRVEKPPETRNETGAIQALIRANLDALVTVLREKYNIEGLAFGSSVRGIREAHDVDYRIVAEDSQTAEHAAMDYKKKLEENGVTNISYEMATAYGNCPRLAYTVRIGKDEIPVEIFFENKQDKTGMFGGLDTEESRVSIRSRELRTFARFWYLSSVNQMRAEENMRSAWTICESCIQNTREKRLSVRKGVGRSMNGFRLAIHNCET